MTRTRGRSVAFMALISFMLPAMGFASSGIQAGSPQTATGATRYTVEQLSQAEVAALEKQGLLKNALTGVSAMQQPGGINFANPAFQRTWERTDRPVANGSVKRSWYWGPSPGATLQEDYAEGQAGKRVVQYFDKSRMEINNPQGDPNNPFYVTNGLLTVELISGKIQTGNNSFTDRYSAAIPLASDTDDPDAPTYQSFLPVSNTPLGDRPATSTVGQPAILVINKAGTVTEDATKSSYPGTRIAHFEASTKHNIPEAIWQFLNESGPVWDSARSITQTARLSDPWFYATGLPISEAYWANVKIAGQKQDVLIQAFERRVVTYAPNGVPGFKVQMGNIGQHYYEWRYNAEGPGPQKLTRTAPSAPVRLTIPALGVQTRVEHVGVDKDNNMDIPKDPNNVAWFRPGTIPGNVGNAVMDGHLDYYGVKQAVFFYLDRLKPGDRAYVRDDKGIDRAFVVTANTSCPFGKCPLNDIFGATTSTRLNLITCAGTFNRSTQNYSMRTVVYTEMAPLP